MRARLSGHAPALSRSGRSSRSSMKRGRSVITASTPRSRQVCRSPSVLTVHTWTSRPESTSRRRTPGACATWSMPGPTIQPSSTRGRSTGQCRACSGASPRAARAPAAARAAGRRRRSSSPAPARRPVPSRTRRSSSTSRRSTRPAYRVGCLVSMASSTGGRRRDGSSSRRRVSTPSRSGSRSGASSSRSAQGSFHDGEVELGRARPAPGSRPRPRCCGTAQVAVVHADEVAVRGQPDVALERVGALSRA